MDICIPYKYYRQVISMCILCRHFQGQVKTLSMEGECRGAVASSLYISTEKSQQDLQLIELHMNVWPARLLTSLMLLAFKQTALQWSRNP